MLCRLFYFHTGKSPTISVLTDLGTVAAAAPTWMASYGAPSKKPSLPSPTVERCSDFYGLGQLYSFKIYNLKKQHSPTSLMRPDVSSSESSAWTFLIDLWTSSLMCSMPTTLPLGPVYKQQRETAIAISHVQYFTQPWMEHVYSRKTLIQNSPFLQSRQWGIHFLNPHLVQMPLQLVCHLTVPKHEHAVKPGPQENIQLIVCICHVCLFF